MSDPAQPTFLIVDSSWDFTQALVSAIHESPSKQESTLILSGDNTKHMLKMMFKNQISDYCYCDFSNEISVSELATYAQTHHEITAVIICETDYRLANSEQRFIFNSLHPNRLLIEQNEGSFDTHVLKDPWHDNHLSCNSINSSLSRDALTALIRIMPSKITELP